MLENWSKSSLARLREIILENKTMSNLTNIDAIESVCITMTDSGTMDVKFAERLLERVRGGQKLIPALGEAVKIGVINQNHANTIIKSVQAVK